MQIHEKLGEFYLGKEFDLDSGALGDTPVNYDARDLCTHAVCVGMTGSGKTGLCLSLLEEAAIDGVPAIAIDPKGDIGNLLLTFPNLATEDFQPWVDAGEATRNGQTVEEFATSQAALWRKGLADWGQNGDRIRRLREAADIGLYTPGSSAGLSLSVLRSFSAPAPAVCEDPESRREAVMAAVSGLLALMQIDADPISSREHILLSNILDHAWQEGRSLQLSDLIRELQTPAFDRVGFMDLETFYPAAERFKLALKLNNVLASPGFAGWLEGEPLDIQRLFYTETGQPRIAIISIAHLSDAERMFFVTILLNELIGWMRRQPGTSSLRALFYMDEVFGYFPPTANPPAKQPMLTLLKQARAFGLGCVLATQNPVDLDYKGLSNAGTWFLGRLQTERDKARVLDGLEGASATTGTEFDRDRIERTLAGLGSRVFLMNNVHEDGPVVFQTRWALSYLRGPLTRTQIQQLMAPRKASAKSQSVPGVPSTRIKPPTPQQVRPVLPPGIEERFLRPAEVPGKLVYRPSLLGSARVHFIQSRRTNGIDEWRDLTLLQPLNDRLPREVWDGAEVLENFDADDLQDEPDENAGFGDLPTPLTRKTNYRSWRTKLKDHVYRTRTVSLWTCPQLKTQAEIGESEADFRIRMKHRAREQRDILVEKLRKKYAPKLKSARERVRKAEQRVEKELSQQSSKRLDTAISIGTSVLGALFGRKLGSSTNVRRAGSAMRSASRAAREGEDVEHARETVAEYKARVDDLNRELQDELDEIEESLNINNIEMEETRIKPRKSDLAVSDISLVWLPWSVDNNGLASPAWTASAAAAR